MSRPTVLLVNWRDTRHPEGGGSERYVERMAAGPRRPRLRVTIQCAAHANAPADEVVDGVRFRRRGGRLSVYLRALFAVATAKADVVVDVQNGMPFFSRLVARCPVLVLVHHVHREQWRAGRRSGARPDRLVDRVAARAAAVPEVPLPHGVRGDPRRAGAASASRRSGPRWCATGWTRRRARGPTGTRIPTLVLVGRLVPHKQVEHAIDAVARLAERWPKLRLEVVGKRLVARQPAGARGAAGRAGPGHAARLGRRAGQTRDHRAVVAARVPFGQGGLGHRDHGGGRARRAVDRLPGRRRGRRVHCGRRDRLAGGRLRRLRPQGRPAAAGGRRVRAEMGAAGRERAATFGWERSVDAFEDLVARDRGDRV